MAARKARVPVNLDALLPTLKVALANAGMLNPTTLTRQGVPKPQHSDAMALLHSGGFERTKNGVRVPLRSQLLALVAERQQVQVRQLAKLVAGATQKEALTTALALAKDGALRIAVRGKVEVVVAPAVGTLTREQLSALARACKTLASQSAKALKRAPLTLLHDDVREQLLDLVVPKGPLPASPPLMERIAAELPRHVHESVGLAFVPAAVGALASLGPTVPEIHEALLEAHRAQRIELRPESGLDRLSREQLALCPPGPQGTRLSWARLLERRS